jgi:hypothetical protein
MKLPPWDSKNPEDQRAFAQFVMLKLDEMDQAVANGPIPEGFMEHMALEAAKAAVARAASEHGLEVKPSAPRRGRPPGDIDHLACAIRDVGRMREIFRRFWGKSNRYTRPTRTAIAAEYWELSQGDEEALERHFKKVKKSD